MVFTSLRRLNARMYFRQCNYWVTQRSSIILQRKPNIVFNLFNYTVNMSDAAAVQNLNKASDDIINSNDLPSDELSSYLITLTEEDREKASNILTAYYKARDGKKRVPSSLDINNFKELLLRENKNQREQFLRYLHKKESLKKKKKTVKKENKPLENLPTTLRGDDHIEYGLGKNSIFLRVHATSVGRFMDMRLAHASLFGPKIVIDLNYEEFMTRKELAITAQQLSFLYYANRVCRRPFDLHFCNVSPSSCTMEVLKKRFPQVCRDGSFANITESSYTSLFPREDLVYLSPHAESSMEEFDPKAIYIIGGFVDTTKKYHLSNERALKENIKCFSLPLSEHVIWGAGSKSLSINQVFDIMLEMKLSNDWRKAFDSVIPKRKLQKFDADFVKEAVLPDKLFVIDNGKNDDQLEKQ